MWLDTLPLARQLLPNLSKHSQAALRLAYDIPEPAVQHRAKEDVEILEQILWKLAGSQDLTALMQLPGDHFGSFEQAHKPVEK